MPITTTHIGGLPVNVLLNTNRATKPNRQFEGGKALGATLHETSNLFASARDNAHWYANPARNEQASVHFFVDQRERWQSLTLAEQSWSAGDGRGGCDVRYIAIEVCVDDDVVAAWENAVALVRALRHEGRIGDGVNFHHDCSGKWCPALLLQHPEVYRNVVMRDRHGQPRDAKGRTNRAIAFERAQQLAEAGHTEESVLKAVRATGDSPVTIRDHAVDYSVRISRAGGNLLAARQSLSIASGHIEKAIAELTAMGKGAA